MIAKSGRGVNYCEFPIRCQAADLGLQEGPAPATPLLTYGGDQRDRFASLARAAHRQRAILSFSHTASESSGRRSFLRSTAALAGFSLLVKKTAPAEELVPDRTADLVNLQDAEDVARARAVRRDIESLISFSKLPVLLKGIMNPLDADRAVKAGAAAGIIVSNHGGRNLDTLPATIEVMPAIVAAVGGRVPVLMDGGIRRGTDIVKAVAHGATAVLIGRPYLYGLAAGGVGGVIRVQKILRKELRMAMALLGVGNLAAINRSVLWPG